MSEGKETLAGTDVSPPPLDGACFPSRELEFSSFGARPKKSSFLLSLRLPFRELLRER